MLDSRPCFQVEARTARVKGPGDNASVLSLLPLFFNNVVITTVIELVQMVEILDEDLVSIQLSE